MTTHSSRADVATDRPERYAKQLVSHLGRKLAFTQDGDTATADVAGTTASITTGDGVLVLQVAGTDPDGVARAEGALASHLVRFGDKDELTVDWHRTAT
ncbi:MAG: hypothetical protein JWO60_1040 [Frankiales bacterium]|nr:hypothetical protein [Frankiales bacterium]